MNLSNFGMDSITLAGPLETKLQASHTAGFSQIMLAFGIRHAGEVATDEPAATR